MATEEYEKKNHILPLVLASGEIKITVPLQSWLAEKSDEFDEPELTVREVNAYALNEEICVMLTVSQESYYVAAETGLVDKARSLHRITQLFAVPEIRPGSTVEVSADVVSRGNWHVEQPKERDGSYTRLNGECTVNLSYTVLEPYELTFYKPMGLDAGALSETVDLETHRGGAKQSFDLALPVEFAGVPRKIGEVTADFSNIKAVVLPGWVKVEGNVCARVPVITEGDEAAEENFVFPLCRYLEVPEAKAGMYAECNASATVFTCRREPQSRQGVLRGLLDAGIRLFSIESVEVAAQTRSHQFFPGSPGTLLPQGQFLLEEVIAFGSSQTLIQREIFFPRAVRAIREPVDARVLNLTHEVIPNKVIVRGILHKQILAVDAQTGVVFAVDVDEAFVHFVDVPGAMPGMRAHINARVEFVNVEIRPGGQTARQVTIIEIVVKVTRFIKQPIVSPVFPMPGPHPQPPLPGTIYIVKSGDTIWRIAMMFGVTMESIITANNLQNPNLIFPGQQLIIPR